MKEFTIKDYLRIILQKMYDSVGAEYVPGMEKEEDWFYTHSWTWQQEDEFVEWLADYLYNDLGARKQLMLRGTKNKKRCLKAAREFVDNYGWKLKEE